MRSFYFTEKNIGDEKYLTYTMGEGVELDEDVLDYCEENDPAEIVKIIYEEDDDFDYLSYDISGLMSLDTFTRSVMKEENVLKILRNVSLGMINIKEYTLPLSYILLNKNFMYINPDTLDIQFLYVPVESDASVSQEFKSFVRQFIASLKFDIEQDLSYVGKLLTYINGDGFNLRGLIGLSEALMKDSGLSFDASGDISTEDGAEVVESMDPSVVPEEKKEGIMDGLDAADDKLPEIGDDEDDSDIELEDAKEQEPAAEYDVHQMMEDKLKEEEARNEEIRKAREKAALEAIIAERDARLAAEAAEAEKEAAERAEAVRIEEEKRAAAEAEKAAAEKAAAEAAAAAEAEAAAAEEATAEEAEEEAEPELTPEQIAEREAIAREVAKKAAREAAEESDEEEIHEDGTGITITQPVRVSRAAMLKAAAEQAEKEAEAEAEALAAAAEEAEKAAAAEAEAETAKEEKKKKKKEKEKKEEATEEVAETKKVVDNTILGAAGAIKINPYLVRVNTNEKIIINKPVFKIGKASRGVDFHVSGNGAVSRQHAIILHKGDSYYIKDNKSTNHTYVDGKEVEVDEEVLLKNNSTISLGDEDFTFKLG